MSDYTHAIAEFRSLTEKLCTCGACVPAAERMLKGMLVELRLDSSDAIVLAQLMGRLVVQADLGRRMIEHTNGIRIPIRGHGRQPPRRIDQIFQEMAEDLRSRAAFGRVDLMIRGIVQMETRRWAFDSHRDRIAFCNQLLRLLRDPERPTDTPDSLRAKTEFALQRLLILVDRFERDRRELPEEIRSAFLKEDRLRAAIELFARARGEITPFQAMYFVWAQSRSKLFMHELLPLCEQYGWRRLDDLTQLIQDGAITQRTVNALLRHPELLVRYPTYVELGALLLLWLEATPRRSLAEYAAASSGTEQIRPPPVVAEPVVAPPEPIVAPTAPPPTPQPPSVSDKNVDPLLLVDVLQDLLISGADASAIRLETRFPSDRIHQAHLPMIAGQSRQRKRSKVGCIIAYLTEQRVLRTFETPDGPRLQYRRAGPYGPEGERFLAWFWATRSPASSSP